MSDETRERSGLDIDWVRTLAAALAAVSSAVLLSTLGAVGTVIGAAVGSVVASVGTALYAQGLARSKDNVAKAQDVALGRIGKAQSEVKRGRLDQAEEQLAAAEEAVEDAGDVAAPLSWRERFATLPWKRIGVFAAATFLLVVLVITAFELVSGRSVSTFTGGSDDRRTTFVGGGGSRDDDQGDRDQQPGQPSDGATPSDGSSEAPTEEPTAEPTTEPSTTPSEEPSEAPTPAPSTPASPTG